MGSSQHGLGRQKAFLVNLLLLALYLVDTVLCQDLIQAACSGGHDLFEHQPEDWF